MREQAGLQRWQAAKGSTYSLNDTACTMSDSNITVEQEMRLKAMKALKRKAKTGTTSVSASAPSASSSADAAAFGPASATHAPAAAAAAAAPVGLAANALASICSSAAPASAQPAQNHSTATTASKARSDFGVGSTTNSIHIPFHLSSTLGQVIRRDYAGEACEEGSARYGFLRPTALLLLMPST